LNKTISVLGSKVDAKPVIDKIYAKYYAQEIAKQKQREQENAKEREQREKFIIIFIFIIAFFGIMVLMIDIGLSKIEKQKREQKKLGQLKVEQAITEGTFIDQRTGLEWLTCDIGQTWNGSTTCLGKAEEMDWDEANSIKVTYFGKSDWRLPTIEELKSIPYSSSGRVYWSSNNKNATASVFSCSVREAADALKSSPHFVRLVRNK
jgi:hypothetical protein